MRRSLLVSAIALLHSAAIAAEQGLSVADKESLQLESELSWMTYLLWGMVAALLLFAVAIRHIARRTTHPCRWCAEFIPNKATTCPRCGKEIDREMRR